MTSSVPEHFSMADIASDRPGEAGAANEGNGRKRPKPGERRVQILQALAAMLEQPGAERVTTAALAARLEVSVPRCTGTLPARHKCSKA